MALMLARVAEQRAMTAVRQDCGVVAGVLEAGAVEELVEAFDLGSSGRLSDGPVARGRLGSIWRLDTDRGSWAVKAENRLHPAVLPELREGAAFQEAAGAAGVMVPEVRRARSGDIVTTVAGVPVRVFGWVDLDEPDLSLDPDAIGGLVAALHRVDFAGTVGEDPWYCEPVGAARWAELAQGLRGRHAPFADELDALVPELVGLEELLGGNARGLRTCHRDLWADNVRRTPDGSLCVFDFDNAGLADPSQELAAMLVEYAGTSPSRAGRIREAYADAGGPGSVVGPTDFAMPIAQLGHILEEGCRRWLVATSDDERADNEAWARELLDRPLTRDVIDSLLA
jgi:Ser/Thr protein kinase RdoA (MazF antagonist)